MTFPQAIRYLESLVNYEKSAAWPYKESLKLQRMQGFLEAIGNPQHELECIHVAGSKGKGSTCAFIAYILRAAGLRVGLYTSPHLFDFRERIRILQGKTEDRRQKTEDGFCRRGNQDCDFEGMITRRELSSLVKRLKPAVEGYNKRSLYGPLSFFEVYTALAFVYFKESKVDLAVLETGLGGRLDATNVVFPLVSAITPISYEHTQKLGRTLAAIAREKAGIIKSPVSSSVVRRPSSVARQLTVVSALQKKEAQDVIRQRCRAVKAALWEVGRDISYVQRKDTFDISCGSKIYPGLKINLLGRHQFSNAAVSVGVIGALKGYANRIGIDSIRKGLYNTLWPGRCEVVCRQPMVILDGAQNPASCRVLKEALKDNFLYPRLTLVLGVSQDKDILGICKELVPWADSVILTQSQNPRRAEVREIASIIKQNRLKPKAALFKTGSVEEARAKAFAVNAKEGIIVVTGSLFVVGEMRGLFIPARGKGKKGRKESKDV